jgi:hypothetical protein
MLPAGRAAGPFNREVLMRKIILASAVTGALILTGTTPAVAAQPERETVELDCNSGETFEVVVNGNGDFSPGRVVGSTRVLIPIEFGDFTFTAVLPDGTVISESEPGALKGGGNVAGHHSPTVTCTFQDSFTLVEPDPEFGGLPAGTIVTFGGTVTGFLTGHR